MFKPENLPSLNNLLIPIKPQQHEKSDTTAIMYSIVCRLSVD